MAPGSSVPKHLPWLLTALLLISLPACSGNRVNVNPDDPRAPKYAYQQHDLALLRIIADDVQELEMGKRYGEIYDRFGAPAFKARTTRREFLMRANCVERHLGELQDFDQDDLGFNREHEMEGGQLAVDTIERRTERGYKSVKERMTFVSDGINFRLRSLDWVSDNRHYQDCLKAIDALPPDAVSPDNAANGAAGDMAQPDSHEAVPAADADAKPAKQATKNSEPTEEPENEASGKPKSKPEPAPAIRTDEAAPSASEKPAARPDSADD